MRNQREGDVCSCRIRRAEIDFTQRLHGGNRVRGFDTVRRASALIAYFHGEHSTFSANVGRAIRY